MLRSHFEFAYILYIIFISSVSSASFGDFCSNNLSCHNPLICSNSSKCICPILSSFWNTKQNSCLTCPRGWMNWQNEKCLLFIASSEDGIIHQKARNACLTYTAQLLEINNHQDFVQFQYKTNELFESEYANAFVKFLSNGVWINFNGSMKQINSYDWCDKEYENDVSSWNNCVRVMKKDSKNDSITSLCLDHVYCNEKLPFICERLAEIVKANDETNNFANIERQWADMIGPLVNLAGSLLGITQQPTPAPQQQQQQPQIQIVTLPAQPQLPPRSSSSSTNTILYIVIAIIIIVIILFCVCGVGFLFLRMNNKDSKMETRSQSSINHHSRYSRTSIDDITSDFDDADN